MPIADSESYKIWYKEWYTNNRERIIEANRERRLADPEAQKAYNREYYQRNKDKIQEYNRLKKREYYHKNREHILKRDSESKKKRLAKKKSEKQEKSPDARKLPREYLPTSEPQAFGMPFAWHQRKKLLELCPLGFLEEQPKENPFHMTFL
jgi:hypothetical protein